MAPFDPFAPMRCPDADCGRMTEPGDTCEHCGCPLTEEAAADLLEAILGECES
jgi:hypothetical protein